MADRLSQAPPAENTAHVAVRLRSDSPITSRAHDYFGYAAHADAVAEIIDAEHTGTPLTIAVTGAWGAGKTSLASMVESRLHEWTALRRGDRPMTTCWFNAWLHDDAPHLGAALAAHVAKAANGRRRWWRRLVSPLPEALLSEGQRWQRRVALLVGLLALTAIAAASPPTRAVASQLALPKVAAGSVGVIAFAALVLWRKLFGAVQDAARFVQAPPAEASIGALGRARDQLGRLIRQARRGGHFVIFVDDLERCRPPRAIEVCEVASQLLGHHGVVTVLMADMEVIAASARLKYKDLREAQGDIRLIGREYLEKMVQLQLALPPPRAVDMKAMLTQQPALLEPSRRDRKVGSTDADSGPGITFAPVVAPVAAAAAAAVGVVVGAVVVGAVVAVTVTAVALALEVLSETRRRLQAHRRRRIDRLVHQLAEAGQSDLEARVLAKVEQGQHDLARKQVRSYLTDEGEHLRRVQDFMVEHPPALPRSAKRMLNHARLLTRIALDRSVFDGQPQLAPEHLGKWIVLCERWWALAEALTTTPSLMRDLEQASEEKNLAEFLINHQIEEVPTSEMRSLLSSDPPLTPVIERLVSLAPGALGMADQLSQEPLSTADTPGI
jgi:hypothetical protein